MRAPNRAIADPRFHQALAAMVRRRVPASDADDVVQSALTDAIASASAPEDDEALRKWVFAIAKNKIADYYRKRRREQPSDAIEISAEETPYSERDLLRWAERELPPGSEAPRTLEWMLREGDGEKLESIAASEEVPAPRVRQRVSRMRRFLRARWLLVAALGVVLVVAWYALRQPKPDVAVTPDSPTRNTPAVGPTSTSISTSTSTPTPTATAPMTSTLPSASSSSAPPRASTAPRTLPAPTAPPSQPPTLGGSSN